MVNGVMTFLFYIIVKNFFKDILKAFKAISDKKQSKIEIHFNQTLKIIGDN